MGTSRLVIPAVQPDWIGAGLIAIARGLRLAAHGLPRASLRFALGYLMMPLWGCWAMVRRTRSNGFYAPTGRKVIAQGNALGSVRQNAFPP